jgi:hypothetical protein
MSEHMRDLLERSRTARGLLGTGRLLLSTLFLLGTACVRWQPIPSADVSTRPLPRFVQLTTRDSVHYMLEEAHVVRGDTLVGRSTDDAPSVRLPIGEIAHLEARVPSGPRSIGMGIVVASGFVAMLALIGSAVSRD